MGYGVVLAGCILGMIIGAIVFMGGAMSDAPTEGDKAAKGGVITFVIFLALAIMFSYLHFVKGIN